MGISLCMLPDVICRTQVIVYMRVVVARGELYDIEEVRGWVSFPKSVLHVHILVFLNRNQVCHSVVGMVSSVTLLVG